MSELRQDVLSGCWVIVSENRNDRPRDFKPGTEPTEGRDSCPFEPGQEDRTPPEIDTIRSGSDWLVRVIPNKYNALDPGEESPSSDHPLYPHRGAYGHHEVLVESPQHDLHLANFTRPQFEPVLEMIDRRLRDLRSRSGIEHVQVFRNEGREAGASLRHPHSQIMALPLVPPTVRNRLERARDFWAREEECLLCRLVREEENRQDRLVERGEHWTVIAPYASRYPYETWLLPRSHRTDFTDLSEPERRDFGDRLTKTAARLRSLLDNPSTNVLYHTTPPGNTSLEAENPGDFAHFRVQVVPRLKHAAGLELSTGLLINPVAPETAATRLRSAL